MTKLLEEAVAQLRTLPEDEQDRAAEVLLAFAQDRRDYTLDVEQIEGIRHAMGQADKGQFASEKRLRKIFGRVYEYPRISASPKTREMTSRTSKRALRAMTVRLRSGS